MKFPQMDEYHLAIQNPRNVFQDAELQASAIEKDQFGLPRVRSGGFALTYRLNGKGKAWAVRCFHKDAPNRQHRYDAVSQFLTQNPQPFFVPAKYLPSGILVNSSRYPITKMPWVEGVTLYQFIERNIDNNLSVIKPLAEQFRELVSTLERSGIAHGDLQHGNILVAAGKLILVDYDGMYVPTLAGLASEERGHVNYQHPQRNAQFEANIDCFSAIVIYMALKAVTPALWHKYGTGENLLFSQDDFHDPTGSRLFAELESIPELNLFVRSFRVVCQSRFDTIPRLADFLTGNLPTTVSQPITLSSRRSQYETLDATQRDDLLAHVGQRVTIVGKITSQFSMDTRSNPPRPVVFLSFGDWKYGAFRLVLWSETLDLFEQLHLNMRNYELRWVSVTGLLGQFTTGTRTHPQIIIESPSEIELLSGQTEAKERLTPSTHDAILNAIAQGKRQAQESLVLSQDGKYVPDTPSKAPQHPQPTNLHRTPSTPIAKDDISGLYKNWQSNPTPVQPKATIPSPIQGVPKPKTRSVVSAPKRVSPIRPQGPSNVPKKVKPKKKWWKFWE